MNVSSQEVAAPDDEDHDLQNVDAFIVDSDDSAPLNHPAKGLLDDPSAGRNLEDLLPIAAADDLYDEIQITDLAHEVQAIMEAIVNEMQPKACACGCGK